MRRSYRKFEHYRSALGIRGAGAFLLAKLTGRKPLFRTSVAGVRHPVFVRLATTDTSVFLQTLVERHYDIPVPVIPSLIIDAGANVGLSAVFFANKYPAAKIIALEPEVSNFAVLKRNAAPYPQIDCRQVALWKEETTLQLNDPGDGNHAFQTAEQKNGAPGVRAVTVATLLREAKAAGPVILKIDIEGAEREVFENSKSWISEIAVVFAELHDNLKPGCENAFHEATREFPIRSEKGETIVRSRLSPAPAQTQQTASS